MKHKRSKNEKVLLHYSNSSKFSLLGCSNSNKNVLELNHHINMGLEKDNHIVKRLLILFMKPI